MKITFYIDNPDLDELVDALEVELRDWIKSSNSTAELINDRPDEMVFDRRGGWDFGLQLQTKKKTTLQKPLEFLQELAKRMKLDIAIGLRDETSGKVEDICFIAWEEPALSLDEVATYLGMSR